VSKLTPFDKKNRICIRINSNLLW